MNTVTLSPKRQLEALFGYRPTASRPTAGSWTGFSIGDTVCRKDDERHEGRLEAIHPQGCTVRWLDHGWFEYLIPLDDLLKVRVS
jgi:hypothetical protein